MSKFFARLRKDQKGATAIEYGLIAALISVGIIGGASLIGGQLEETFDTIAEELGDAERTTGQ